MLKIYGYGPTRWAKCVWMARELGLEFEEVVLSFDKAKGFGDEKYRGLNPFGLIPALEDGEFKLFESQAINNYLAEKYPEKGLIPKSGTFERAEYDQWTFLANTTLEGAVWSWFRHSFIFNEKYKSETELKRAAKEIERNFSILDKLLEGKEFLVSNKFTGADISMTYILNWAGSYGFLDNFKTLQDYRKRMTSREAFPGHLYKG